MSDQRRGRPLKPAIGHPVPSRFARGSLVTLAIRSQSAVYFRNSWVGLITAPFAPEPKVPQRSMSFHAGALSVAADLFSTPARIVIDQISAVTGQTAGISNSRHSRQLGNYTARVLKGENPATLPVIQSEKGIAPAAVELGKEALPTLSR